MDQILVEHGYKPERVTHTKHWNVRRVWHDGKPCIAKFISYLLLPEPDVQINKLADRGYKMERFVYSRVPDGWPIELVDSFRVKGQGYVIITTEYVASRWDDYKPSSAKDKKIAEQLTKQLHLLHALGVVHNDLERKNIMLHPSQSKVAIIDFEKSFKSRDERKGSADFLKIVSSMGEHYNTYGIAVEMMSILRA